MNKKLAAITISAGLGLGGFTGVLLGSPSIVSAAEDSTGTAVADTAVRSAKTPVSDVIAALVADGTLTQAQADKVTAALEAARPAGGRGGPGKGGRGANLEVVATAIGVTADELKTALRGGQTIAQVAESKGVAVQTVVDAMVADFKTKIQAKVDAGTITQADADAKVAEFTTRATESVNNVKPAGGPGGHGERGPRGGAPAEGSDTTATTAAA